MLLQEAKVSTYIFDLASLFGACLDTQVLPLLQTNKQIVTFVFRWLKFLSFRGKHYSILWGLWAMKK